MTTQGQFKKKEVYVGHFPKNVSYVQNLMIKIDTLRVLSGHVPREVISDIGIFAFLATAVCLVIMCIALIEAVKEGRAHGFRLSIFKTFVAVITGYICLYCVFFVVSWGHTIPSLLPMNNKLVIAEVDTNSADFKTLIENSDNLKSLVNNFPEKEQKSLDRKIVFNDNKCYFEMLFNKKELKNLLNKNELEDAINNGLESYIKTVKIYAK